MLLTDDFRNICSVFWATGPRVKKGFQYHVTNQKGGDIEKAEPEEKPP
jgi:hypothetical protein